VDTVPFELAAIDAYPSKQAWDAAAADLVTTMLARWHLVAREALVGGEAGSVLRVTTAAGEHAVLKVGFPHVEAVWEAVGLESWGPRLAPRVLRQDPWTWAMLLEDVQPGIPLSREGSLEAGAELYARLSEVPAPRELPTLAEAMRPFVDKAVASSDQHAAGLAEFVALLEFSGDASLHGDYNPGNVLQRGEDWVTIDPKPMRGDPAFDLWPLVSQIAGGKLEKKLELACEITGVDADRAARWGFARSALNISWFLADGNTKAAAVAVKETAEWAAVSAA